MGIEWLEHGFGTRVSTGWPPRPLTTLKQIHSNIAIVADGHSGCVGEGDALVTNHGGTLLGVRTADCVPILFVDRQRRVVAAVHAGWRGTAEEVAMRALERMQAEFNCNSSNIEAAIGPAIGACCYEVGTEVATRFRKFFPERTDLSRAAHIDLAEASRRQLVAAGVPPEHIYTGTPCTQCSDEMHSYRRDGAKAGRMYSVIGIREKS